MTTTAGGGGESRSRGRGLGRMRRLASLGRGRRPRPVRRLGSLGRVRQAGPLRRTGALGRGRRPRPVRRLGSLGRVRRPGLLRRRGALGRLGPASDHGQVGGIEALPFGVLIFVIGTLLVVNAWGVVDAKLAADAAAREATRRFVEAPVVDSSGAGDAESRAVAAGLDALAAHGRDPGRASVALTGLASPEGGGGYVRCARATFTASYRVPALTLPWIGGYGEAFQVTSSHSELVDPFRDGVPGEAESCG